MHNFFIFTRINNKKKRDIFITDCRKVEKSFVTRHVLFRDVVVSRKESMISFTRERLNPVDTS